MRIVEVPVADAALVDQARPRLPIAKGVRAAFDPIGLPSTLDPNKTDRTIYVVAT